VTGVTIRPAETDADLDAWRRVRIAVLPNERTATVEEMRQSSGPDQLLLLAELDGDVVGCGIADRSDLAGQGSLAPRVIPDARRRGVGTALLRAVDEHLRAHGVHELTVGVSTANEGALRMYAREGFRPLMSTWWARPVPEPAASPGVPVDVVDPEDVDDLRPLWRALCEHHDAVGPAYLPERRDPDEAFDRLRDHYTGDESILLRAPGGYLFGYVGGGFDVWDTGRVGAIEALVVADAGRGRGTGAALLNAAFEVMRTRRANAVELDVLEGNARAAEFYARLGLEREFETLFKQL
jgi:GNAT superfamily N-acetyltransferase